MKKIFFASMLMFASAISFSQDITAKTNTTKHSPYISIGAGISAGIPTYGMEIGIYDACNNRFWIAATSEVTPDADNLVYAGVRAYYSIMKPDAKTTLFFNLASKIGSRNKDLVFEPGLAFVYAINDSWCLQWNVSTSLYEETNFGTPIHLSTGPCVNFCF